MDAGFSRMNDTETTGKMYSAWCDEYGQNRPVFRPHVSHFESTIPVVPAGPHAA